MEITPSLSIPDGELRFAFIHSSGPGGQNVNKVATAVQLRFDVRDSPSLPLDVKERLIRFAGSRVTAEGELVIEAKRYRSQERNRLDALDRLAALLEKASHPPAIRHVTRPTLASHTRRLETKKKHGTLKKQRKALDE